MSEIFNIYCDESCHLEHDESKVMVLGAVWCPLEKCREIAERLREIKLAHGLKAGFETKWTKISPAKADYYQEVLDYFFDDDDLFFRAVVVDDKTKLTHAAFDQDHDDWYFKMYFRMLEVILHPDAQYRIYLDRKDTRSSDKVNKLHEVLCNSKKDFNRKIIERVQVVESHHVEQIQLCDLLIGILGYKNRLLSGSKAKEQLVTRMIKRSGYSLVRSTLLAARKVNIMHWRAAEKIV